MKVKEESETVGVKFNIQKTEIMASGPIHGKPMGKQWKEWQSLFWSPLKSLQMGTANMKLKDTLPLGRKFMTNLGSI